MPITLNLDPDRQARLNRIARARNCTPEALLAGVIDQYLKGSETPEVAPDDRHPSGKPWPYRSPVGGIITPL